MSETARDGRRTALRALAIALAWGAIAAGGAGAAEVRPAEGRPAAWRPVVAKTATPSTELLLPLYEVETGNPGGVTTLYAVRNESGEDDVEVTVRYFESDRPQVALHTEVLLLAPKEILTVNMRDKVAALDLPVDPDGFARGYVTVSAATATIQGDTFQVDTSEAFASGGRLLDVGPTSAHGDLCNRVAARFLDGLGFSSSEFRLWLAADAPPDPSVPVLFYTVYDEDGDVRFFGQLHETRVAFVVDVDTLFSVPGVSFPEFGAIEFELNGTVGHVTSLMNAAGEFSVSVDGVCQDLTAP